METTTPQEDPGTPVQGRGQEATALLRADHKLVSELFREYRRTKGTEDKRAIVGQICDELTIHAQIEEEIFYPAVKEAIDDPSIIDEAAVEHATLKALISKLEGGAPGEEKYEALVKVLGEYVAHHVDEEQTEIFPRARGSDLDMKELGARLAERKMQLKAGQSPEPRDQ